MVAFVRGVHGLKGAVRVEVLTHRPQDRFAPGRRLHREGSDEPLTIVEAIPDGRGWRLRFAEVSDRGAADRLRNAYLEALLGPEEALSRGEYYWHEVIGAVVRDLGGEELGVVVDVYRVGEIDAYVVRGVRYGEFDVPGVRAFIRIFAPRRGEIVVDADALELRPARPRSPRQPRPKRSRRRNMATDASPRPLLTPEADTRAAQPPLGADDPTR